MKTNLAIIFLVLLMSLSGCATKHFDMIAEGDVKVLLSQSADIEFSKADVHRHQGKTEIEIVVRPAEHVRRFTVGSIKVLVTYPDGHQQTLISDKAHVDSHRLGSTLQHAHYFIFEPTVLPSGTVLNVSYEPEGKI